MLPALAALLPSLVDIGGKIIDRVIPDPEKAAAAKLEIAKLKASGELAKMANDTEVLKAYMADTDSARKREMEIATSDKAPWINKVIGPYLAVAILGGAMVLFLCMIFGVDETFGTAQKEIMLYILGVLSAMCTQVVSYYFGSSRGDAANAQAMREIMKKP